jgi:hypothetical protein
VAPIGRTAEARNVSRQFCRARTSDALGENKNQLPAATAPESVGANSVPVSLIPGRRRVSDGRARRPSSPLRRARGRLRGEKGQPRQAFGKCVCSICFWLLVLPRIGWERDLMACHSLMICFVGMEYLKACPRCRLMLHESLREPLAGVLYGCHSDALAGAELNLSPESCAIAGAQPLAGAHA